MLTHVMWDVETLGLRTPTNTPPPLAIGAVKFNRDKILDKFRVGVDPVDAERYGMRVTANTFMWWMDPKHDAARADMFNLVKVPVDAALSGLIDWLAETPEAEQGSAFGKGSTFDNVLVNDWCVLTGLKYPLTYRQDECYRTLANRNPDIAYVQLGTAHDPLDDAASQAMHLQALAQAGRCVL